MDGDVYADMPYLYSPALSGLNTLSIGAEGGNMGEGGEGLVFSEGGSKDGMTRRQEMGVPETEAGRKKWFLNEAHRKSWELKAGETLGCDFFNPYLDFNGTFSAPSVVFLLGYCTVQLVYMTDQ